MKSKSAQNEETYHWSPQPEAAAYVARLLDTFLQASPAIDRLAARMRDETGTRLVDWVDSLQVHGRHYLIYADGPGSNPAGGDSRPRRLNHSLSEVFEEMPCSQRSDSLNPTN